MNVNKQTPMQEFIQQLREDGYYVKLDLESHFLEKEQKNIEEAVNDTEKYLIGKNIGGLGRTYYNSKFK